MITRAEVIFQDEAKNISIEKKPGLRALQILTPPVALEHEEARRIFLLNEFGELILKYQKQAYLQIREMLISITDPEGRNLLIEEFEAYKKNLSINLNSGVSSAPGY